jgi:hypothetical protein
VDEYGNAVVFNENVDEDDENNLDKLSVYGEDLVEIYSVCGDSLDVLRFQAVHMLNRQGEE